MLRVRFLKNMRFWLLLALFLVAWFLPATPNAAQDDLPPAKVNLALRRTADGLLRASGDGKSRIPSVKQVDPGVWQVMLEHPFQYDSLPALLQASLDVYGIQTPYEVAVRNCFDATLELGYHQSDYLEQKSVPCGGRIMPEGCHYLEITFLGVTTQPSFWAGKAWIMWLLLGILAGFGFFWMQKKPKPAAPIAEATTDWLEFGQSKLDVAGQVLLCAGTRETLTFRETKLLRLFAARPDQLLERDFILQEVWADEGVMVGRSVDVFVSRLRKKLAADPSVGIVAVHGVGYRLETGKG